MLRIPDHLIADIRERTDIVQTIGRFVELKRSGSSHKGLCPFHAEKTPSFYVSEPRKSFYCFGCGEKGDVFAFLMKLEGRGFLEVARQLADAAGVELPRRPESDADRRRASEREQALSLNRVAADFYREAYLAGRGAAARRYVASRGLGDDVAETFRLGYAPAGWDALARHLAQAKAPAVLAVGLGLVAVKRQYAEEPIGSGPVDPQRHYDFFRDRLMFPILATGGKVLGFSGRLLDPEAKERKYVNSPETIIYRKSETLFGLHVARSAMRRAGRGILVEGNIDVLALHEAGFAETVAPLGTALTDKQVQILRRCTENLVLAYDGDRAGRAAMQSSVELIGTDSNFTCRVAMLPAGRDPADMAASAPQELTAVIDGAKAATVFLIEAAAAASGESIEERVRALEGLREHLGRIDNPVVREEYFLLAASAFGLKVGQVERVLRGGAGAASEVATAAARRPVDAASAPTRARPMSKHAKWGFTLLAILVKHPHLAPIAEREGAAGFLDDDAVRDLVRGAIALQADGGAVDSMQLIDMAPETWKRRLAKRLLADDVPADAGAADRALSETLTRLKLDRLERDFAELEQKRKEAGQRGDKEAERNLIRRCLALGSEQLALKTAMDKGLLWTGEAPRPDARR